MIVLGIFQEFWATNPVLGNTQSNLGLRGSVLLASHRFLGSVCRYTLLQQILNQRPLFREQFVDWNLVGFAMRRRDVHQQRRLFAHANPRRRHSPNSNRLC
jgi:hypothetical protein